MRPAFLPRFGALMLGACPIAMACGLVVPDLTPPPECGRCPRVAQTSMIHIVADGSRDAALCGSEGMPCDFKTGIARSKPNDFLAFAIGDYAGSVQLESGRVLCGGYESTKGWVHVDGATSTWTAESNVAVRLARETFSFDSISLKVPDAVGASTSAYGIFAMAGARVCFERGAVTVGNAHDGAAGSPGAPSPASDCKEPGDGAPGLEGRTGRDGVGTIDPGGFLPGDGEPGTAGGAGHAGSLEAGPCPDTEQACELSSSDPSQCIARQAQRRAATPACGGGGGGAGSGGGGGGSAFGVFMYDARIALRSSSIRVGSGGRGGAGGTGAPGGPSRPGDPGVCEGCNAETCSVIPDTRKPLGKVGVGGRGGDGGDGGRGADGWSCAVFVNRKESFEADAETNLIHGSGGAVRAPTCDVQGGWQR